MRPHPLHPVLCPPVQEKYGLTGAHPAQGQRDDGLKHLRYGKRIITVQPGQGKAPLLRSLCPEYLPILATNLFAFLGHDSWSSCAAKDTHWCCSALSDTTAIQDWPGFWGHTVDLFSLSILKPAARAGQHHHARQVYLSFSYLAPENSSWSSQNETNCMPVVTYSWSHTSVDFVHSKISRADSVAL